MEGPRGYLGCIAGAMSRRETGVAKKEETELTAEVLDKFSDLITTALGLVAALAWNEAINSSLLNCWATREGLWPPSSSTPS